MNILLSKCPVDFSAFALMFLYPGRSYFAYSPLRNLVKRKAHLLYFAVTDFYNPAIMLTRGKRRAAPGTVGTCAGSKKARSMRTTPTASTAPEQAKGLTA